MEELTSVKYGLYRIIIAAICFIFVFCLHFFTDFTEISSVLQQSITDNSGPGLIEQYLYEIFAVQNFHLN